MTSNTWAEIDVTKIPNKCFKKYRAALLNETEDGDQRYPDVLDREICREKMLNRRPSVTELKEVTDDSRYSPIADIIRTRT
jgi:hypothetical protein